MNNVLLLPGLDVAELVLIAFALFFLGLVFYLRREDRREGYPLEDEITGRVFAVGGPLTDALPKTFKLSFDRGTVTTQTGPREPVDIAGRRADPGAGSPYIPTGNPLTDRIGPASYAERAHRPDIDMFGNPRIVPLSTVEGMTVSARDLDPRGLPVYGADGVKAGTVSDLWVDRADQVIRYMHVALESGQSVLVPWTMSRIDRSRRYVDVHALSAHQFAGAPVPATAGVVTLNEEDRIQGYFGGGYLYGLAGRTESLI